MKPLTIDGTPISFDVAAREVRTAVHNLDKWEQVVKPLVSATVDDMIVRGNLPIRVAEAFDDIGQFCMKLGQEIMHARTRRKMPMPPGPEN